MFSDVLKTVSVERIIATAAAGTDEGELSERFKTRFVSEITKVSQTELNIWMRTGVFSGVDDRENGRGLSFPQFLAAWCAQSLRSQCRVVGRPITDLVRFISSFSEEQLAAQFEKTGKDWIRFAPWEGVPLQFCSLKEVDFNPPDAFIRAGGVDVGLGYRILRRDLHKLTESRALIAVS